MMPIPILMRPPFRDREHAGRVLASHLESYRGVSTLVLAIPNGGVPVAIQISKHIGARLDLLLVRKLHIPWNPEDGFGSLTSSGQVMVNNDLMKKMADKRP